MKVKDLEGIDLCLWHNKAMIKEFLEKEEQRKKQQEEDKMREKIRRVFGEELDDTTIA